MTDLPAAARVKTKDMYRASQSFVTSPAVWCSGMGASGHETMLGFPIRAEGTILSAAAP